MTISLNGSGGITYPDGTVNTTRSVSTAGDTINGTLIVNGNLSFNSGYGSAATAYGCRAWVNFNGAGTVAIRASGNVSSITDNGTGDYTVNFTTAMADANYALTGASGNGLTTPSTAPTAVRTGVLASGSVRFRLNFAESGTTGSTDDAFIYVVIFR